MSQQPVQRQDDEDHERRLDEVGHDAEPDEAGVGDDVRRGGRGVPGRVDPHPDDLREGAEDCYGQVEDACGSGDPDG